MLNFSLSVAFLFTLSNILTFFTGWLLGFFVLIKALKDRIAITFAGFSLSLSLWALFYFFSQIADTPEASLRFISIALIALMTGSAMLVNLCTRFAETFVKKNYSPYRKIAWGGAMIFIGLLISDCIGWTHLLLAGSIPKIWFLVWPQPGILFELFLIFSASCFLMSFFLLSSVKRQLTGANLFSIIYIGIAIAIIFIGIFMNYLLWYDFRVPPLGGFLVPFAVLGIFYAITRHHLLNIKVITTELLIFFVWIFTFSRILLAANSQERIFDVGVFLFVFLFGIFIIQSVANEVRQRERAEELFGKLNLANAALQSFNDHLQQKVEEQTQEVRKAYEVEKKARIELEELDKAKDQFILTTQHHLRTPLTIIKGFLTTSLKMEDQLDKLAPQIKSYLEKAAAASDRMAKLINEFLGVSQLEVGKSIFKFQAVNLKKLIEEIYDELSPEVEEKKLSFSIVFSPEVKDAIVHIDRESIKAALYNLIDNSVKYTPTGGITITGEMRVHPIEKNKIVRVCIRDTGIGISREELPDLFSHYFQRGEEAEKMYTTGRGIGLVLAKNIIKAHHGQIFAESEGKGKGTTFVIELPA